MLKLPSEASLFITYAQLGIHSELVRQNQPKALLLRIHPGLIEIELDKRRLIATAEYLIWIPAGTTYATYVRQPIKYMSISVSNVLAARLPDKPCLFVQTAVVRALLDDLHQRRVLSVVDEWDVRQAELLIEHLVRAGYQDSYLPEIHNHQLTQILKSIQLHPDDSTTLAQWAQLVNSTERTLARHFQRELGMNFIQWRNRARLLQAITWLQEGWPVQRIAARLGYSTPSAFITMFRKLLGFTPERYRQLLRGELVT